jgi:hypothetical protein
MTATDSEFDAIDFNKEMAVPEFHCRIPLSGHEPFPVIRELIDKKKALALFDQIDPRPSSASFGTKQSNSNMIGSSHTRRLQLLRAHLEL